MARSVVPALQLESELASTSSILGRGLEHS